jgi:cysteine-rich repeat protein
MRFRNSAILVASAAVLAASFASRARADYDMSGPWHVSLSGPLPAPPQHYDVVQNGGNLQIAISNYASLWSDDGTIDEGTGAFVQNVESFSFCGTDTLTGSVAADGKSFTATYLQNYYVPGGSPTTGHCEEYNYVVTGSRCGNGGLNVGEDCDDGNRVNGDCCSSSCTIEGDGSACSELYGCGTGSCTNGGCVVATPTSSGASCQPGTNPCLVGTCDGAGSCAFGSGSACEDDGEVCTDDVCGSGVCQHLDNTGPCEDDGNVCTNDICDGAGTCAHFANSDPCALDCSAGACSAGTCIAAAPNAAAGVSCDLDDDVCTIDKCDGAGTCVATPDDYGCPACETCEASSGCVPDLGGCNSEPRSITISMQTDPGFVGDERLKLRIKDGIDPVDLGDPTASTGYTVCLYRNDSAGVLRTWAQMDVAPGGTCGTSDCWSSSDGRFVYRDKSLSADGIRAIDLNPKKGIAIAGAEDNLGWAPTLETSHQDPIIPKIIASNGVTSSCWLHSVPVQKLTSNKLKGRYKAD